MKRIAIVGAGLSGLIVAQRLRGLADVTVFEKSRGPGGRMATRYAGDYEFDHGAQFFTARTPEFRHFLAPLLDEGVVADWPAEFAELDGDRVRARRSWCREYPHYVGVPRMSTIGRYLSRELEIVPNTRIVKIERLDEDWTLIDEAGNTFDGFRWLVLTPPAAQTASLAAEFPDLAALCAEREMLACYALMLGFQRDLELPWQAAVVRNAPISWISVNSSKPGRKRPFTLLVHSTNAWANQHVDDNIDAVRERMLDEATRVCGQDLRSADHCQVHRWRYANIDRQIGSKYYVNISSRLAACGDWFVRGRIEAAFTSASSLAERILEQL